MLHKDKTLHSLTDAACGEGPWRSWANGILLTAGVGACVWMLSRMLINETLVLNPNPMAIVAIILVNITAVVMTFVLWRNLVQTSTGVRVSISSGLVGQAALMIGKYVPGKIVGLAGRFLSLGHAVEPGKAVAIVLVEQIYVLIGLGVVGLTLAGLLLGHLEMLAIAVAATCAGALVPRIIMIISALLSPRIRPFAHLKHIARILDLRHSLWLCALASMAALCVTASAWFVPDIIGFSTSIILRWQLVGAYALSILVGMAAFILPGGIGAREGVFFIIVQPMIGADAAIASATLLRLVNVMIDLSMGMTGLLLSRWMDGRNESCSIT